MTLSPKVRSTKQTEADRLRDNLKAAEEKLQAEHAALKRLQSRIDETGRQQLIRELRDAEQRAANEATGAAIDDREPDPQFDDRAASLRRRIDEFDTLYASEGMRRAIQTQAEKRTAAQSAVDFSKAELFRELARPHGHRVSELLHELGAEIGNMAACGKECGGYHGRIADELFSRPDDWVTDRNLRRNAVAVIDQYYKHWSSHNPRGGTR